MLTAIANGFKDGYDQPGEFSMGLSYESQVRQLAYDLSSHVGQWVSRLSN